MKILTTNGVVYNSLTSQNIYDFIHLIKKCVVVVEDTRTINYDENGDAIEDFTQEELNKGLEAVKEILANERELLKEYFLMFSEASTKEASLRYAKEFKKDEINKARDLAIAEILYNEKVFFNNFSDRALISTFLASDKESLKLIAKDNSTLLLSKENAKELNDLMFESLNENTLKARRLKDEIQNAKNMEELLKIEW